jgi:hypothetical protein
VHHLHKKFKVNVYFKNFNGTMMARIDSLIQFKNDLESFIKSRFEKWLDDEKTGFNLVADLDTSNKLNRLLNPIGLEVYGMKITPVEFEITFEFVGNYKQLQEELDAPKYCRISLNNDGNYYVFISNTNLSINFWLTVADDKFNRKIVGKEKFDEIMIKMSETLFFYKSHIKPAPLPYA